jgi:hypothetical protein
MTSLRTCGRIAARPSSRHLARPEPRQLDRLGEALEPLVDFAFDLLQRHGDAQAALELAQCFQRALHVRTVLARKGRK